MIKSTNVLENLAALEKRVLDCRLCEASLPLGPRPVLQIHQSARILIAGQAPGSRVHETGVPFDDPSGDRLRNWMGVNRSVFYDKRTVAILPMGFCYPGRGKNGDLPPLKLCAETWREPLLAALKNIQLSIIIGQYAMQWHLKTKGNLTKTVREWKFDSGNVFPIPHPSPRNNIWLKKNSWFEKEVLPMLKRRVAAALTR